MKVGLALGGGGVRGLAHVLALETLDACGITPAAITGTSMGAIIGALYASGRSGKEIRKHISDHIISRDDRLKDVYRKKRNLIKWLDAVRPSWEKSGLLKADRFLEYLLEDIQVATFEELQTPLQVVANAGAASPAESHPLFAERCLGPELAEKAYGPLPSSLK